MSVEFDFGCVRVEEVCLCSGFHSYFFHFFEAVPVSDGRETAQLVSVEVVCVVVCAEACSALVGREFATAVRANCDVVEVLDRMGPTERWGCINFVYGEIVWDVAFC